MSDDEIWIEIMPPGTFINRDGRVRLKGDPTIYPNVEEAMKHYPGWRGVDR